MFRKPHSEAAEMILGRWNQQKSTNFKVPKPNFRVPQISWQKNSFWALLGLLPLWNLSMLVYISKAFQHNLNVVYPWFAMTSSKSKLIIFLTNFLHNVNNLVMEGFCKFQVDIPINARLMAVQSLEKSQHIYIAPAMLVGERTPTGPFSHITWQKRLQLHWPIICFHWSEWLQIWHRDRWYGLKGHFKISGK